MANYRVIRSGELYHFGVPGMRWGHRKLSVRGAAKSARKLRKLDKRIHKQTLRAAKFNYKSARLENRNSVRAMKKSAKFKEKANKAAARAAKAKVKGIKVYQKLEKRMANTPIDSLRTRDIEEAKKFAAIYLGR